MKDTTAYQLKDGRILLISYKGSTVFFTVDNPPFDISLVTIASSVVNPETNIKVTDFTITKRTSSFDCSIDYTITETMEAIPEYLSDIVILKKINDITQGKYYFDIEITENGTKYKLLSGILVLKPEFTRA